MSRNNRIARLIVALSVAALIGAQIPVRGGTALARDGYPNKKNCFGTALTVGLLGAGIYGATRHSGGGGGGTFIPAAPAKDPCKPATLSGDPGRSLFQILGSDSRSAFAGMNRLFAMSD